MNPFIVMWVVGILLAGVTGRIVARKVGYVLGAIVVVTILLALLFSPFIYEFPSREQVVVTFDDVGEPHYHSWGIFHPIGHPPTTVKQTPATIISSAWVILDGNRIIQFRYVAEVWVTNPRGYLIPSRRDDDGSMAAAEKMAADWFERWNTNHSDRLAAAASKKPADRLPYIQGQVNTDLAPLFGLQGLRFFVKEVEVSERKTPADYWGTDPVTKKSLDPSSVNGGSVVGHP